jgi:hypothetical protein
MKVVCTYCLKYLRGEEDPEGKLSHGVCEDCKANFLPQWVGLKVSEYLNRHDKPIVIVKDGRVIAANETAKEMVGKTDDELGLLGGEFMECKYSRLPEQCGNTVHCKSCTIRNTVEKALAGVESRRVPATLFQDDQTIHLLISALRIEDAMVLLTIEDFSI